jgi:hypothetical protein
MELSVLEEKKNENQKRLPRKPKRQQKAKDKK